MKDGKKLYEEYFADWFQFIRQLKTEGLPARPEYDWKSVKPMQVCVPQDTSSIQKSIGMGGACKACNLFVTLVHVQVMVKSHCSFFIVKVDFGVDGFVWEKR